MGHIKIQKAFGASLRLQRKKKGLSQTVLAQLSGLHRTYISDVERGARNLSLCSISALAEALDISVADFFPLEDSADQGDLTPGV
jgi:transcriptional regulator with XRE-family HTH domain